MVIPALAMAISSEPNVRTVVYHMLNKRYVRCIAGAGFANAAVLPNRFSRFVGCLLIIIVQQDIGPLPGQRLRNGKANAYTGPGNQGRLVVKSFIQQR